MDESFNLVDRYCLSIFPEMLEHFSEEELRIASSTGSYIFHEDYFVKFIGASLDDDALLARVAAYLEYLAENKNNYLVDLAEIGILESVISKDFHQLAPHLRPCSRKLVQSVLAHCNVAPALWN